MFTKTEVSTRLTSNRQGSLVCKTCGEENADRNASFNIALWDIFPRQDYNDDKRNSKEATGSCSQDVLTGSSAWLYITPRSLSICFNKRLLLVN